jgi:alpha-L-arabinofuranosidase
MLVGVSWGINAVRADRAGKEPAYFHPTGQVTMFYGEHHGSDLLAVVAEGVPRYEQPYGMGSLAPKDTTVACIDVVATAGADRVYVHAINRSFQQDIEVILDLSDFRGLGAEAIHHTLVGRLHDRPAPGEPREVGRFESEQVGVESAVMSATLPKRSVSIIEISCNRQR